MNPLVPRYLCGIISFVAQNSHQRYIICTEPQDLEHLRSAVRTRVGRSRSLMDQLMPLQVLELNAFCAATRELTHEFSMSSVPAMLAKFTREAEAKFTFCTMVLPNVWMLFIEMLRDIEG